MEKKNILEVSQLSKTFDGKIKALSNCSFKVSEGNICAIVGSSGSGKSTLLRLIAGLERPDGGEIRIGSDVVSSDSVIVKPQSRNVGFVFQDFALFPHLTVEANINYGLKKKRKGAVDEILKLVSMEGYNESYPSQLSGGQEQRVALARTLASDPQLLLLDEPFSSLDITLKSSLRKEIKKLVRRLGTSMVFITHDIADAVDIADEILLIKKGELLQQINVEDLSKGNNVVELDELISELKSNAEIVDRLF